MPDVAAQTPITWIDFEAFWYGIHSSWFGAEGQPVAIRGRFGRAIIIDGAAQDETYGCVGSATGGLVPAPRLVRSYQEPAFAYAQASAGDMVVTSFECVSPVRFDASPTQGYGSEFDKAAPSPPDILVTTLHSYTTDFISNTSARVMVMLYKFFMDPVQSVVLGSIVGPTNMVTRGYGWGGAGIGRSVGFSDSGAGGNLGNIQIAAVLAATPIPGVALLYPSIVPTGTIASTPATFDSVCAVNRLQADGINPTVMSPLIVHQNRLLYLGGGAVTAPGVESFTRLGANSVITAPERVTYLPVNAWYDPNPYHSNVFIEDQPFGMGAVCSVNASELFVVKQNGGGYTVRNDIDNPTIIHLPSLQPTGVARNIPVACPLGVVYGSNRGVWVWTNGDTATDLAPQLDGWFWKPGATADFLAGEMGSFAYQHPYLFAPNNWIYDTRTQAWWRFGNPNERTYAWNSPSASGEMLCGPLVINADQPVLCDWFDQTQGTSFYHYLSHPLQRTKGQVCLFRRLRIGIQGQGTVKVTLRGLDGTYDTQVFEVTDPAVEVSFSRPLGLDSHDVTVQIDSQSTVIGQPAPTVWRASFGFLEREALDDGDGD